MKLVNLLVEAPGHPDGWGLENSVPFPSNPVFESLVKILESELPGTLEKSLLFSEPRFPSFKEDG